MGREAVKIGEWNMLDGIVREVRADEDPAIIRIQLGESIVESHMPKGVLEETGLKVGDRITVMIDSTQVAITK